MCGRYVLTSFYVLHCLILFQKILYYKRASRALPELQPMEHAFLDVVLNICAGRPTQQYAKTLQQAAERNLRLGALRRGEA
jgi:hypothetical protein